MALINLQEFKDFINMTESFADQVLGDILNGEIASFEQRAGLLEQEGTETTEFHDGDNDNCVLLKNGIVTEITSVKEDLDEDGDYETDLEHITDYFWYADGTIMKTHGYFPDGFKNIEVVYKHGYTSATLPRDLRLALLKTMANTYNASMTTVEEEGTGKKFSQKEIDKVLGKYVRLSL